VVLYPGRGDRGGGLGGGESGLGVFGKVLDMKQGVGVGGGVKKGNNSYRVHFITKSAGHCGMIDVHRFMQTTLGDGK